MNCSQVRELLPVLLYGDVSAADKIHLEKHVDECAACRREFAALQGVRRLLGVAFGLGEPITLSINSELQSYSKRAFGERVRSPFGFVSATLVSIGSCVCTPPCCRAKAIMTLLRSSPLAHEKARTEARAPIAKWQIRNVCDCAVATGRCWYG